MAKGEEPPKMGDVGPVEGVAKKQCNMTIPYAVEGEKQSEVKIRVLGKSYLSYLHTMLTDKIQIRQAKSQI